MSLRTVVVCVAVVGLGNACPSNPCSEEPAYGGLGNDEVWITLRDAKPRATTGDDAPTITSPTAGQVVNAPFQIAWESPLKLSQRIAPDASEARPLTRWPARSLLDDVSALFIPSARAHLPPVSSDAYLVQMTVEGRECPVEVVTTELAHTLDQASFSQLSGDVKLELTSAYLDEGIVREGPFAATPITFKVER